MAIFKSAEINSSRLDWKILQNTAICLYYQLNVLEDDLSWFKKNNFLVYTFDCSQWRSVNDFHDDVNRQFKFPDYYGRNLDAFNDCLSDIEISGESGMVIVFSKFDHFYRKFSNIAYSILNIIATNSRYFLLTGQKLITLVQSEDPRIEIAPVGACPVMWNQKEWLNKNRGL